MSDKKIITVIGATGAQGGGLVRAILGDSESAFAVRAITRNAHSSKTKILESLGAEIVVADIDDVTSLKQAFTGAYGVFCVTPFWEHMSPERERAQASNMAHAAKDANVSHVIWSTLEDTRRWVPLSDNRMPTLMGKYKVPHFDAKGEANSIFTELDTPTTFLQTSFYWDNLIHFGMGPKRDSNGRFAFTLPMSDKKMPGMAAEDIGKCAYAIFKKGKEMIGKTASVSGEHLTAIQMADSMTKILGRDVYHNDVTAEVYRSFDFPGADDLGNMFQFYQEFETDFCGTRNLDAARVLNPEMLTFAAWLDKNKNQIPLE